MDLSELLKLQKKVSTRAGKKRSHLKKIKLIAIESINYLDQT